MKIEVYCPTCNETKTHKVLKTNKMWVVRCIECSTTHKVENPLQGAEENVDVRVVVSKGENSYVTHVPLGKEEILLVGEEFVVDDSDEVSLVEITSLEGEHGRMK